MFPKTRVRCVRKLAVALAVVLASSTACGSSDPADVVLIDSFSAFVDSSCQAMAAGAPIEQSVAVAMDLRFQWVNLSREALLRPSWDVPADIDTDDEFEAQIEAVLLALQNCPPATP